MDKDVKGFNPQSYCVSMIFCQFADWMLFREISSCWHSANGNLNYLGGTRTPSKSNLAK